MTDSLAEQPLYKRILLKLSGEAFCGDQGLGIAVERIHKIAQDIKTIRALGVELALVVGAGNYCRGSVFSQAGFDRVVSDHIGMLATVMNALALQDILASIGISSSIRSAFAVDGKVKPFYRKESLELLDSGEVLICAGGTGNPLVTTDTAAAIRAVELKANALLKATKVEGVYTDDPETNQAAKFLPRVSYNEILAQKLSVMDLSAICIGRDNNLTLRIFNMDKPDVYRGVLTGEEEGTIVSEERIDAQ